MLHYFIVLNTMKSHLLECVVMQNYKVEVKNHSEAMEAQDLFLKMGFRKELFSYSGYPKLVITDIDSIGGYSSGAEIGYLDADKITLQELRDMVVLKRNDVNDANYEAIGTNFYKGANWYKWDASIGKWIEYVGSYTNLLDSVKPIKKEEVKMKEYLVKNAETGDYFLTRNHSNFVGAIEIPEGANKYIQSIKYPERFGFLRNGSFWDNKWIKHCDKRDDYIVLWQRESLNDQVASAEEYRQSFAKQNGIPIFLERQKFTQPEELPFVGLDTKFATEYQAEFFRKDDELDGDLCVEYVDNAWNKQIGGDHYKKLAIQPMEYALQNKLDYAQANVVKYVTRHADKNGKQDLLKAIHNIELMIAHYYSDQE